MKICTVKKWRYAGLLRAHAFSDRNDYLYEVPGAEAPVKYKWKLTRRAVNTRNQ